MYSLSIQAMSSTMSPENVLAVLLPEPDGLSAPEIRARLGVPISQPTLWRRLQELIVKGQVTVEGHARATRYHATERTGVSTLRSRLLHGYVARQIAANAALLVVAGQRLERLRQVNPHGRVYHDRWQELISGSRVQLLRALTEDSERADVLRKESPFTTLIPPEERRRIFESVRATSRAAA
jgi:predicted ArsR family transcriptional regulator